MPSCPPAPRHIGCLEHCHHSRQHEEIAKQCDALSRAQQRLEPVEIVVVDYRAGEHLPGELKDRPPGFVERIVVADTAVLDGVDLRLAHAGVSADTTCCTHSYFASAYLATWRIARSRSTGSSSRSPRMTAPNRRYGCIAVEAWPSMRKMFMAGTTLSAFDGGGRVVRVDVGEPRHAIASYLVEYSRRALVSKRVGARRQFNCWVLGRCAMSRAPACPILDGAMVPVARRLSSPSVANR